jgi:hypothetical protein
MSDPTLYQVVASARIGAPPARVYDIISDYRVGHPSILPGPFRNLRVEEGGRGAGTVFSMDVHAFGRVETMRMKVSEPEPGRVLKEQDLDKPTYTLFTVERGASDNESIVTFDTRLVSRAGIAGWFERALSKRFLSRLYAEELGNLDRVCQGGSKR